MSSGAIYEPGDRFTYPDMKYDPEEGTVECIDRQVLYYRKSHKYYKSYLFDGLFDELIKEMHKNVANKYDNVLVIYGGEGTGKSHLAYQIAKAYNPNFDMSRNYIYNYDSFLQRITEDLNDPPGTVYWLDEGSNIASNREWMKQDNISFISILEMFRSRGWTLIFCIPLLSRLDVYIRETRVRYIIKAAVMSWDLKFKKKSRGYGQLTRVDVEKENRPEKTMGYFPYSPIPEPDLSKYEKLKLQSQTDKLEELNNRKNKVNQNDKAYQIGKKYRKLILKMAEDGYSHQAIADTVGTTVQVVANDVSKARKEAHIDE